MLAVATPEVLWWTLLPLLFLSVGALLLLTVASIVRHLPDTVPQAWTVVTGLVTLVACVPMWQEVHDTGPRSTLAGSIAVDGSTVLVTALLAIVVVAVALLARPYLRREDLPGGELYVRLMLSAAGGVVMASADDLIVLFLGLEILSIAVYVMAAFHLRRIESQEGAMKYFVLGAFASAFLLYGMALVYGATGSTRLALIAEQLSTTVLVRDGMLLAGVALMLVGFAFKVAAVPFHAWTPDVYEGAPAPVVAWMAAGVKAAAFAAMVRVLVVSLGTHASDWTPPVGALAVASVVIGAVVAVLQTDVRRMLAYSSIAHAGFLLLGVQASDADGTAAVYAYLVVYALLATGSFAVLTVMGGEGDHAHHLDDYRGLARRRPVLAGAFTVLLLGQAGVPFTGGFVAKLGVLASAVADQGYWVAGIAMLAAAAAAFVYLRILVSMYLEDAEVVDGVTVSPTVPAGARVVIAVSCAGVLFIGLVPGPLLTLTRDAVPVLVGN